MQAIDAHPLNPNWNDRWKTEDETRQYVDQQAAAVVKTIRRSLRRSMHLVHRGCRQRRIGKGLDKIRSKASVAVGDPWFDGTYRQHD
jgi:hypothetical protein